MNEIALTRVALLKIVAIVFVEPNSTRKPLNISLHRFLQFIPRTRVVSTVS